MSRGGSDRGTSAMDPSDLAEWRGGGGEVRVSSGGRLTLRAPRPEAARYMVPGA